MSSKSIPFGWLGALPKIASETKTPSRSLNRSTIVLGKSATRRSFSWKFSLNKETASIGLVVVTAGMLVAYVFGINQSAAKGYEVTREKNKLNELVEDNRKLLVRVAEVGSIVQIQQEAEANQLVQITNQEYLEVNQFSQR